MPIIASDNIQINWPIRHDLGEGCGFNIYLSAAGGEVDFAAPINASPVPAWPFELQGRRIAWGKGPWGRGRWGVGDGGFGWGSGPWGSGPWGRGSTLLEYLTNKLTDGEYKLAVVPVDAAGNEDTAAATIATVTVAGTPAAPTELQAAPAGDDVLIVFQLSANDQQE